MTMTRLESESDGSNIVQYSTRRSLLIVLLNTAFLVVMLLKSGTGLGLHTDSPASMFLNALSQLETYKCPSTTLAPIDYVAPLLQTAAIAFATTLDADTESLSRMWRENQRYSYLMDGIIKSIEKGLSTPAWPEGVMTRITKLHLEHNALYR